MRRAYLGRGWSFPPAFSRERAGVDMLEEEADIASSLEILLTTAQGERTMLPEYGCDMDEMLFESIDTRMKTLMTDKIETAILYHEARIELEAVTLDAARNLEGMLVIEIVYRVKSTNARFNFVFPYYKLEGTDLDPAATVSSLPERG
jgi:phage baseplate assembly protein W